MILETILLSIYFSKVLLSPVPMTFLPVHEYWDLSQTQTFTAPIKLNGTPGKADLPNKNWTPGLSNKNLTKDKICAKGFRTGTIRNVPEATKSALYRKYHINKKGPLCPCEIDHLIPLELGGSNSTKNLWPQPGVGDFNFHVKDALETHLHELVCQNKLDLDTARKAIASDWIKAYNQYMSVKP